MIGCKGEFGFSVRAAVLPLFLVVSLLSAGCTKWSADGDHPYATITASISEKSAEGTRTYLDGLKVLWSSGDTVSCFISSTLNDKYVISSGVGTRRAKFDSAGVAIGTKTPFSEPCNIAMFPYDRSATVTDDGNGELSINTYLNPAQKRNEGSFDGKSALMVSKSQDRGFSFMNSVGLIRFKFKKHVPQENFKVTKIKLQSLSQKIAGDVTIYMYGDSLYYAAAKESGVDSIVLDCAGSPLLSGTTYTEYYLALPPVTFPVGDFKLTVYRDDNHYDEFLNEKEAIVIRRSKVATVRCDVSQTSGGGIDPD